MSTTSAVSGSQSQAALLQLIQQLRQSSAQKTSASSTSSTDTTGSSAAAQALAQFFQSSDTDGNGQLSESELSTGLQQNGNLLSGSTLLQASSGGTDAQDAIKSLIESIKSQLSGQTSQSEGTDPHAQFAKDLFSSIDTDNDGTITKDEVETAVTKAGGTKESADALYAQIDPENTGSVSEQQFADNIPKPHHGGAGGPPPSGSGDSASASGTTTYDPADTNQDGTVSEEERLAALGISLDGSNTDVSTSGTTASSTGDTDDSTKNFFAQIRKEMMNFLISLQTQAGSSGAGNASA